MVIGRKGCFGGGFCVIFGKRGVGFVGLVGFILKGWFL